MTTSLESRDEVVEHPTFLEHIKKFFDPIDIDCMAPRGFDLATYEGVKASGRAIYQQTKSGNMPKGDESRRWTANRVKTFYNWMRDKYPMGESPFKAFVTTAVADGQDRGSRRRPDLFQQSPFLDREANQQMRCAA